MQSPRVVVLAGPNGAGKSTFAPYVLRGALHVDEFVNADVIARGLSAFRPEQVSFEAGHIMLTRLKKLAALRTDFALETTLASRSIATWLQELQGEGYTAHLVFVALQDAETALARVRERVGRGGHDIPEETVRRRFLRGLRNLFTLYLPVVDDFIVLDNTAGSMRLVATGARHAESVFNASIWAELRRQANVGDVTA